MSLERDIEILKAIPFFEGFSSDALKLLAFGAESQRYVNETTIFRAGEETNYGLVIRLGSVLLQNGEGETVERCSKGTLIAAYAFLAPTTHLYTGIAQNSCEAMKITKPVFTRVLDAHPELAKLLHERIAVSMQTMAHDLSPVAVSLRERL